MNDGPTDTPPLDLTPRFADGDPMRVIGLAERYTDATRHRIPQQWQRFAARLGEVRGRVDPATFGLCYPLGNDTGEFEYIAGVMVDEDAPLPDGFVERRPPVRRFAVFTHRGHVTGIPPLVHAVLRDWLPTSGYRPAGNPLLTEVYGDGFDPATASGEIEVWLPLANA